MTIFNKKVTLRKKNNINVLELYPKTLSEQVLVDLNNSTTIKDKLETIDNTLSNKSDKNHTHDIATYTKEGFVKADENTISLSNGELSINKNNIKNVMSYDISSNNYYTFPDGKTIRTDCNFADNFIEEGQCIYNCSTSDTSGNDAIVLPTKENLTQLGGNGGSSTAALSALSKLNTKYLYMPDNISSFGQSTFFNSSALEYIRISPNITEIPNYCFRNCSNLKEIRMNKITKIGSMAFNNCKSLKHVIIEDSSELSEIGDNAFSDCQSLENADFLSEATCSIIPSGTFNNCKSLKSVTMTDNIDIIETNSFSNCLNLNKIKINSYSSNSNKKIEIRNNAFNHCYSLDSVVAVSKDYVGDTKIFVLLYDNNFTNSYLQKTNLIYEFVEPETETISSTHCLQNLSRISIVWNQYLSSCDTSILSNLFKNYINLKIMEIYFDENDIDSYNNFNTIFNENNKLGTKDVIFYKHI